VWALIIFFIFALYLVEGAVIGDVLLPLFAHVTNVPSWVWNFLGDALSKYFSGRPLMLKVGSTALKRIRSLRGSEPYNEACYQQMHPLLAAISRLNYANLASTPQIIEDEFKSKRLAPGLTALLCKRTQSYFEFREVLPTGLKLVLHHRPHRKIYVQIDRKRFMPDIVAKVRSIKPELFEGTLGVEFAGERGIDCGRPRREFFTTGDSSSIHRTTACSRSSGTTSTGSRSTYSRRHRSWRSSSDWPYSTRTSS
jgi:hypothetical protein